MPLGSSLGNGKFPELMVELCGFWFWGIELFHPTHFVGLGGMGRVYSGGCDHPPDFFMACRSYPHG